MWLRGGNGVIFVYGITSTVVIPDGMIFVCSITNMAVIPAQAGILKRSLFFAAGSGLPRLTAAEGALSFLLIEKKQKIKACILSCKNLRKSLSRQYLGSCPGLFHCTRLILPWVVRL